MSARISAPSPRCSPDVWGPRLSGGPHSVAHSQKGRRRSTTYKRVLECPSGRSSDRRSSSYGQWPFVTLEIDPERIAYDETVGGIAVRLVNIGGKFVGWVPDLNRRPAFARFTFSDPAARASFIAEALQISGVSIAALR